MLEEVARPFTLAEKRLICRRALPPKIGTVFWMQDERRLHIRTFTIVAVTMLIGVLFHQILAHRNRALAHRVSSRVQP